MALKYLLVDDSTGKRKLGAAAGSGLFIDQHYDVGGGGQVNFIVTQAFTVSSLIDVMINGRLTREHATKDYTRNTTLNRIEFNYTVPENAWVLIRVYL